MNIYKARSNAWEGERDFDLLPDTGVNVNEKFGKGSEVYILLPVIGGVANIPPLSRVYIHTPGATKKKTSKRPGSRKSRHGGSKSRKNSKSPSTSRNQLSTPPAGFRKSFKPADVYKRAMGKVESKNNWKTINEGLEELKGLITTDAKIIIQNGSTYVPTICKLVNHNNKQVARTAMASLGDLYYLQPRSRELQTHLKDVISVLVKKTADKIKILSNEAETNLTTIITSVNVPVKYKIMTYFIGVTKDTKSSAIEERCIHHLAFTVKKCKVFLIKDPTSSTPLFDLIRRVSELWNGKHENTRKKAREIITVLTQESMAQDTIKNFKQDLIRNAHADYRERVMNLVNEIDNEEFQEYNRRDLEIKTNVVAKKPKKKTAKKKKKKIPKVKGSKVMTGVEAIYTDSADLTITGRPEDVYKQVQIQINKGPENWKESFEALNNLRYLCIHHSDMLKKDLKPLTRSLLTQLDNLRSSIQKNSLLCFEEFYRMFKHRMDKTLHLTIPKLVRKATDSNDFISEAGNDACNTMVDYCTPKELLKEFMITIRQEKATSMKERAAFYANIAVERLNTSICTDKNNPILDDVVTTTCPIMYDKNPNTRETANALMSNIVDFCLEKGKENALKKILDYNVQKMYHGKTELLLSKLRDSDKATRKSKIKKSRQKSITRGTKKKKKTKKPVEKKNDQEIEIEQLSQELLGAGLEYLPEDTTF